MASTYDRHIFRQLEEVMKKCDNLSQEIKDIKKEHKNEIYKLKEEHKKEVRELNEKIKNLEKENTELKDKIDVLEGKSNQKNSTNSNIPPSKDEHRIQNHRQKTFRKPGGQKGRKGKTLTQQDIEYLKTKDNVEFTEEHYCDEKSKRTIIKHLIDIKTKIILRKIIIHGKDSTYIGKEIPEECKTNSTVIYGNNLKALVGVMSAQEVIAIDRMAEFLRILTEDTLKVSHGSIVNWISEISRKSKKTKKKLRRALRNSKIISTDLTPTSLRGKDVYSRNYSNEVVTVFETSRSKRIQEIQRHNILPNFKGNIMHDHETGLYNFGIKSKHLECWIHLGRELKYFDENIKNSWSKELWDLAWSTNQKRKEYLEKGITKFTVEEINEFETRFDEIVEKGLRENQEVKSKYLRNKEKPVLNRLKKYKINYTNYIYDFDLPFDDNLSERDLRPIKIKKKISGCHRSFEGFKDYCNLRTIISTCIKQGINYFNLFKNILDNKTIPVTKTGLIIMP